MTEVEKWGVDPQDPALIEQWRRNIRSETFAFYHYEMGVALRQTGTLPDAVTALRRALDLRPDLLPAYEVLRQALLESGNPEEAADIAKRAIRLAPDFVERGPLEVALRHYDASQFDAAATVLEALLTAAPDLMEAWGLLTIVRAAQRRFDAMLAAAHRVGLMRSDHARLIALELARMATQVPDGTIANGHAVAEVLARAAIQAAPNLPDGYKSLATVCTAGGKTAEVVWSYRRLLALDPGNVANHWHLANHLSELADKAADSSLDRALRIDPDVGGPMLHSAWHTLAGRGRLTEAERVADRAVARGAEAATSLYLAGLARHLTARFDEALSFYDRVLPIAPIDTAPEILALGMKTLALTALGRTEEAFALSQKIAREKPSMELPVSCAALVLQKLGRFDEAMPLYRRALDLGPRSGWSHINLGLALDAAGDEGGALAAIRRAVEAQPRWIWFHSRQCPWNSTRLKDLLDQIGFTRGGYWVTALR